MNPSFFWRAVRCLAAAAALVIACPAGAQTLFKCGTSFQDRPCETKDVQQRFSHTAGKFSVEQVNGDTDKDCADMAARLLPFWQRARSGESIEKIRAEIEAQPGTLVEKSRMRDVAGAFKEFKGTPLEVRADLERHCMNYKRVHGLPTDRDIARNAQATADLSAMQSTAAEINSARAAEDRARADEARLRREEARYERARARAERAAIRRGE